MTLIFQHQNLEANSIILILLDIKKSVNSCHRISLQYIDTLVQTRFPLRS